MKKAYIERQLQESAASDAYELECMQRIIDDIHNNCPNDRIETIDGLEVNKGQLFSIIKSFNAASAEEFQNQKTTSQLNTKLSSIFPNVRDIETVDWFVVHTGSHAYTSDILVISRTNKSLKPISGMPELNSYKYGSIEIKRYSSSKLFQPKFVIKNDNGNVGFKLSHAYISQFNAGFNAVEDILLNAIYQSDEYDEFNKQFLHAYSNLVGNDSSVDHSRFTAKLKNATLPFNSPEALQAYIDRVGSNYIAKNIRISNFEQLLAKYYFDAYSDGFRQTPFMQIGKGKNAQLFKLDLSEKTISQYDPLNIRSFAKNFSDVFNSIVLSIRIRPEMNYKIVADMHFSSKLRKDAFSYDPNGNLPPKRKLS